MLVYKCLLFLSRFVMKRNLVKAISDFVSKW